jgi:hypothetical protein
MITSRVAATIKDIDASSLFYKVDGKTVEPINPVVDMASHIVALRSPSMLEEFSVVDAVVIDGCWKRGRFLEVSDALNPVPKTIFQFS